MWSVPTIPMWYSLQVSSMSFFQRVSAPFLGYRFLWHYGQRYSSWELKVLFQIQVFLDNAGLSRKANALTAITLPICTSFRLETQLWLGPAGKVIFDENLLNICKNPMRPMCRSCINLTFSFICWMFWQRKFSPMHTVPRYPASKRPPCVSR